MRDVIKIGIGLIALAVFNYVIMGCSRDNTLASTEVENEIAEVVVSGTAATGYAIEAAAWIIFNEQGDTLAEGITDSAGAVYHHFTKGEVQQDEVLLLQVDGEYQYTGISLDSGMYRYPIISPISNYFVKNILLIDTLKKGVELPTRDSIRVLKGSMNRTLFGVNSTEILNDSSYVPARRSDWDRRPSHLDAYIHSFHAMGKQNSQYQTRLLDSIYQAGGSATLSAHRDFQLEYALIMSQFGVDSIQGTEYSTSFNNELDQNQMYEFQMALKFIQSDPFVLQQVDPYLHSQVTAIFLECLKSVIYIMDPYQSSEGDNYYLGEIMHISGAVVKPVADQLRSMNMNGFDSNDWEKLRVLMKALGEKAGGMFKGIEYKEWKTEVGDIRRLTERVIKDYIFIDFTLEAYLLEDRDTYLSEHLREFTDEELQAEMDRLIEQEGDIEFNTPPHIQYGDGNNLGPGPGPGPQGPQGGAGGPDPL